MVYDLIRDSTFGTFINYASNGKLLPFPEERPDFVVPSRFLPGDVKRSNSDIVSTLNNNDRVDEKEPAQQESTIGDQTSEKSPPEDPYLVDWYGPDDPENPHNWSPAKRAFVALLIGIITFSAYIGSAIYTPSIPGIMEEYSVSQVYATLGLTLYIIAYGLGPMIFSPFQEMAVFGRNTVYVSTFFLFVVFQIPILLPPNVETIMAFRFVTGFFGSPALATGGATIGDMYPPHQLTYVLALWSLSALVGPITGPVIGGFAAKANGWKWPMYELIWISGFSLLILIFIFPETYGPTILLRRAQRLRKLTGNNQLRTATEKAREADKTSVGRFLYDILIRPFVLAAEPMVLFGNIYMGFLYALFYLWFESFVLVFDDVYHFGMGLSGLPFLGFIVTGVFTYTFYVFYIKYHIGGRYARAAANGTPIAPEVRLELGLMASLLIPISVLIFGFTARPEIHWIVPVIGASLYFPGIFLTFQSVVIYMAMAYPLYVASVFAGNGAFRAIIASVFPLFGRAMFLKLGLGGGSGLLAGLSLAMMPFYYGLIRYGPYLRQRSQYATSSQ